MVHTPVPTLDAACQCKGRLVVGAVSIAAAIGVAVKPIGETKLAGVVLAGPLPILRLLVLRIALNTGQDSLRYFRFGLAPCHTDVVQLIFQPL